MSEHPKNWVDQALDGLRQKDRLRSLRPVNAVSPVTVKQNGRTIHLFSSNDYLGLSAHASVRNALQLAAQTVGMGPRGAALVCGYTEQHAQLEKTLARLKGAESALLCPSGYQANVALLSALGDANTVIFSDALNHASIIDGCRLSRATTVVYAHRDMKDLKRKLAENPSAKKVVVTDEVFSMDGDHAPLQDLAKLKKDFDFIWVTDSAHSTLVHGPSGGGLSQANGVQHLVDFQVGTLSKAIGSHGGFVATSSQNRHWLLNTGRAFIFSTALPVPIVAAAHAAIQTATETSTIRETLWDNIRRLASYLGRPALGPIFPIVVGGEVEALRLSQSMMLHGFHVPAIRPPTVPEGTCRLRVTVSAAHAAKHIDALAGTLKQANVLL